MISAKAMKQQPLFNTYEVVVVGITDVVVVLTVAIPLKIGRKKRNAKALNNNSHSFTFKYVRGRSGLVSRQRGRSSR